MSFALQRLASVCRIKFVVIEVNEVPPDRYLGTLGNIGYLLK